MASPQALSDWVLRDGVPLRGPFDRLGAGLSDGIVPVTDFCVSRHPVFGSRRDRGRIRELKWATASDSIGIAREARCVSPPEFRFDLRFAPLHSLKMVST